MIPIFNSNTSSSTTQIASCPCQVRYRCHRSTNFAGGTSPLSLSTFSLYNYKIFITRHMALKSAKLYRRVRRPLDEFRARVCFPKNKRTVMGKPLKFPGITQELQEILDANMEEAPARRRAREAFKGIQLSIDHCLFKVPYDGLKMKESYEVNSRGLEIFSKSWLPGNCPPKAVVCLCHGYGDTCTFFLEGIATKLASFGYGVFAMDYPGFGLSEGLHGYVPSFDMLVDDVIEHYSKIKENPEFHSLPSFLFGQSMGGAVALKMHLKQPNAWNGAILVAPMCKIADDMVPPWLVTQILIGIAKVLPKQKLVPQKNLADMAFRDLNKRKLTAYNVIAYKHKPRLRTALELLRTTEEIEHRLEEVSLPLLILHGEDDAVTDPSVSKALYEKASSSDKKLNLYMDAYHALLEGEPDEMIFRVFGDIIQWLDEHSIKTTQS